MSEMDATELLYVNRDKLDSLECLIASVVRQHILDVHYSFEISSRYDEEDQANIKQMQIDNSLLKMGALLAEKDLFTVTEQPNNGWDYCRHDHLATIYDTELLVISKEDMQLLIKEITEVVKKLWKGGI